jgi:cytochrome c oxidase cbb3-type subunit III
MNVSARSVFWKAARRMCGSLYIEKALIGALLIFAAVQGICSAADSAKGPISVPTPVEQGAALYTQYCAMCHGSDGEGYSADEANALANPDFLKSADDAYIAAGIVRGRPGTPMSAWGKEKGGPLGPAEVSAILAFMRSWQTEPSVDLGQAPVHGDALKGAELYERWCAACHGKRGEGGQYLKLGNPIFLETAGDAFIRYAIDQGRRNTPMMAYRSILSPKEIDDVVAYVRSFQRPDRFEDTVAEVQEALSQVIQSRGVLHPGNPPAEFALIDGRYVPADDVYAAHQAKKSFIIVDARPGSDYLRSHIQGAISIPFYDMPSAVGLLPKNLWIITYCGCPHAISGKAADTLKGAGYDKVAVLDEGFFFWQEKEYPVVIGQRSDPLRWLKKIFSIHAKGNQNEPVD